MNCNEPSSKLARLLEKAAEARSCAEQYEAQCAVYVARRIRDQLGPYDTVRYEHDSAAAKHWRRVEVEALQEIEAEHEAERQRGLNTDYGTW